MVEPAIFYSPYPVKAKEIVPLANFIALTPAFVELLTKVESCQTILLPRITEVVTEVFASTILSVISKTLLEFSG